MADNKTEETLPQEESSSEKNAPDLIKTHESTKAASTPIGRKDVVYKLRDINGDMVSAWEQIFQKNDFYGGKIEVSKGDIFKDAPAADAIVSPANSFGFMDGGIDMAISLHFGWQLQERLQKVIREKHEGEILVGKAVIIPIFEPGKKEPADIKAKWVGCNENKPIKFLISAPTMRVPQDVSDTSNAYLAFRGIILAVDEHNKNPENEPIRSVLCPGLGTAVGRMPGIRCAFQMHEAYKTLVEHDLNQVVTLLAPEGLESPWMHDQMMREYGHEVVKKGSIKKK